MTDSPIQVNITNDQMHTIVQKAIFDSLTEPQKDDLLFRAVQSVLMPDPSGYYGRRDSKLQLAFDHSVTVIANEIVHEKLNADPEVRSLIEKAVAGALLRIKDPKNYDSLEEAVAKAIPAWFSHMAKEEGA